MFVSSTALLGAAAISAAGSLASGAISSIMQYSGMKKQAAENANINQLMLGEAAKERKLKKWEIKLADAARKRAEKYQKERDKTNNQISFMNNIQSNLMRNPQAANRLMEIQKMRRAA